jgi:hypothetical protein
MHGTMNLKSVWTFSHSPINSWKGHLSDFEAYLVIFAFAKEMKRAVAIVDFKNSGYLLIRCLYNDTGQPDGLYKTSNTPYFRLTKNLRYY